MALVLALRTVVEIGFAEAENDSSQGRGHGREHGIVRENPVKGVKRVRRAREAPRANRPWTTMERRVVLERVPDQLRAPTALAMFTGLRKGEVLRLPKSAIRDGRIWRRTAKTGYEVSIPLHPDLMNLVSSAAPHDTITASM
jgi:integrase